MANYNLKSDNKGFSLIELIVIMAIMTVAVGMMGLSVSLLTGSAAKQACEKINAQLNEAKTGSMTRYEEDLNIVFVPKNMTVKESGAYEWADREGYYAVKQMSTVTKDTTSGSPTYGMPLEVPFNIEHRYICDGNVEMTLNYDSSSEVLDTSNGVGFLFDRATGLYKGIKTGCTFTGSGSVTAGTTLSGAQPKSMEFKSGLKTYKITFVEETGKHYIDRD